MVEPGKKNSTFSLLLVFLTRLFMPRHNAQLRLLKAQIHILRARIPAQRIILTPAQKSELLRIGAESLAKVRPIDNKDLDPRAVEQPGDQVFGLERRIVEEAVDIEVVDGEIGGGLDRGRQEARGRHIDQAIDYEFAVMVGEAANPAVGPFEPPAGRKRRHLAGKMRGKRRGGSWAEPIYTCIDLVRTSANGWEAGMQRARDFPPKNMLGVPRSIVAVSVIVLLLLVVVWVGPRWALNSAIASINKAGLTTSLDEARSASLVEASAALASIDRGDLLFRASPDDLRRIVNDALAVVTAASSLPVDIKTVTLSPDRQAIQVSADISGIINGGIRIDGRIHGAMVPSFAGRDLVLRTAFDRIELRSLEVPGWHWLPGGIVRLLNPAIADAITRINGAIPVHRQVVLPEPTAARAVQVGGREIVIPALTPATPAAMIDGGGLHVLAQLLARDPASTSRPAEGNLSFDVYRSAFAARAEASHPGFASLPLGTHFSSAFLERLLGDMRVVGTTEDLAREAVRTAARGLNLITGPDIVLRIPADQAVRLINGIVADALSKGSLPVTVERVRPSIQDGVIVIDADARAEIPISPIVKATTMLEIRIVAVPEGTREGERDIRLLPRVAWVKTVSTSLAAPGDAPFAAIWPTFNAFLEGLVATVNSTLPAVPVALPAASTEPVDIPPVAVAGGSVAISPARFQPPAYRLDRAVVVASERGLWVLADASVPGAPAPSAAVQRLQDPDAADATAVDAAIAALVAERYGETPADGVFGLVSWRRFAELFNAGWMALGPSAEAHVDTGTVPMQSQSINLAERGRFSCTRTEQCNRPACHRPNCNNCDQSCPSVTVSIPYCDFRGCGTNDETVEEPSCVARRTICNLANTSCNAAAELEVARCDVAAEATVAACNVRAEAQVGLCQAKLLLTNGIAEISGVGSISGDSRVRVNASLDARRLILTPDSPGAEFHPILAGSVVGNLAIDWTPYDAIGHLLVCPVAGKIFAEVTVTFPDQPFRVAAAVEDVTPPSSPGVQRGPTVLGIRTASSRVPLRLEPGLLTSLVAQNPQILLTCPVASSLLVPGLVVGGSFRAIAENQLAAALAPTSPGTALMLYASQDADVRATMGVLFGGSFSIPIDAMDLRLPLPDLSIVIPGGELILRPVLERGALRYHQLQ